MWLAFVGLLSLYSKNIPGIFVAGPSRPRSGRRDDKVEILAKLLGLDHEVTSLRLGENHRARETEQPTNIGESRPTNLLLADSAGQEIRTPFQVQTHPGVGLGTTSLAIGRIERGELHLHTNVGGRHFLSTFSAGVVGWFVVSRTS